MRDFKKGDIVVVTKESLNDYVGMRNFPEKIGSTMGTITHIYHNPVSYKSKDVRESLVVRLDICPGIANLIFKPEEVTLIVPVELEVRLAALERHIGLDKDSEGN